MELLNDINSSRELTFILIRSFVLYLVAFFLIRLNRRLHIETSFDFVFIIMIGAILERGIFVDSTTFINSIAASISLIILQKIFAYSTFYSKSVGKILKGKPVVLYENSKFHKESMQLEQITKEDIMAACRRDLQCNTLDGVKQVNLERTGKISFIQK